ncbi:heme-binding protein [Ancylobacter sonchi]|uniref:GlcG/HbpS family heme-binding protein n=1 Tax=Ancylobacter TaxID=99 RepID=UPI001BD3A911|nr:MULTISPECIES: heme-binding protein [Ancylobacter]MBS7537093.1 heme-binding protein [Ancylobacter sonchi]MCB4769060.1 heme-binding protein [Ancylobacter sp. Lp-2]
MSVTRPALKLTHDGALKALHGALAKATELGVPQNITIVDEGGNLLAYIRMDGAKLLSRETSMSKAVTAASHRQPSSRLNPKDEVKLSLAAGQRLTNLEGGLPIIIDGQCVGAIGVGSGKGAEDVEVARAGLAAIGAEDQIP